MRKAEIIRKTLIEMRPMSLESVPPYSDEPDYEETVIAELQGRLPDNVDIKTCEDLKHLSVECCDACHGDYAHYEMSLIDLPDGGKAWVCDPVRWAIYPEQKQQLKEWQRNSPAGKLLRHIFGGVPHDHKD
jgi:hypothetical protein